MINQLVRAHLYVMLSQEERSEKFSEFTKGSMLILMTRSGHGGAIGLQEHRTPRPPKCPGGLPGHYPDAKNRTQLDYPEPA